MLCEGCGRMIGPDDSFCGSCGKPVEPAELVNGRDITLDWLAEALTGDGYTAEKREDQGKLPALSCQHPSRSNVTLILDHEHRIINCVSWWKTRASRWSKGSMLEALNRANRLAEICTLYVDDENDLGIAWYLPLFSRLASVDVVALARSADEDFRRAVDGSGLAEFLG